MSAEDLDRKSKMVLEAVYELGGEADTSEVKDYTGIESNGVVLYRYDKLEEVELIDTYVADRGDTLDVTIATLTDKGRRRVGQILEDNDGPTVVEQVQELRTIVSELNRRVQRFEGRIEAVESSVEGVDEVVETHRELDGRMAEVEDTLDTIHESVEAKIEEGEERLDKKLEAIEAQAETVKEADRLNADVRKTLSRYGLLSSTRGREGEDRYEAGEVLERLSSQHGGDR
jgi:DNA-binding PadR family transcriptional regulator